MIGIEVVKEKETKKPAPELAEKIRRACFERGVIVWRGGHYGNVIRLLPPLVITKELLNKGLEVLEAVIKETEHKTH